MVSAFVVGVQNSIEGEVSCFYGNINNWYVESGQSTCIPASMLTVSTQQTRVSMKVVMLTHEPFKSNLFHIINFESCPVEKLPCFYFIGFPIFNKGNELSTS